MFEGGSGVIRGGRSDKSSESGDLVLPLRLDSVDCGGVMRVLSSGRAGDDAMTRVVIYLPVNRKMQVILKSLPEIRRSACVKGSVWSGEDNRCLQSCRRLYV